MRARFEWLPPGVGVGAWYEVRERFRGLGWGLELELEFGFGGGGVGEDILTFALSLRCCRSCLELGWRGCPDATMR